MIKTDNTIFSAKIIQREARKDAVSRSMRKQLRYIFDMDIPEATGNILHRTRAHLSRRSERRTKEKWIVLAKEYSKMIACADSGEIERMDIFLQKAREAARSDRRNRNARI